MKEKQLKELLAELQIVPIGRNRRSWLVAKCPFAEYMHRFGTDSNPSFFIKINDSGYSGYNCLSGDTRYVTKSGTKTLAETAGTYQEVMAPNGDWIKAKISYFGEQELHKVTLSRNGVKRVVHATANHRWFKTSAGGKEYKECVTKDLLPKERLLAAKYKRITENIDLNGVIHGIIFGDGSKRNATSTHGTVRLFGNKMELAEIFKKTGNYSSIRYNPDEHYTGVKEHIAVCGKFAFMKELPNLDSPIPYLLGFIAGYIATDGNVSNGCISLSSSKREHLEALKDICSVVGIETFHIARTSRLGYGVLPSDSYRVNFVRSSLFNSLFVRTDQRRTFESFKTALYERKGWQVCSVEQIQGLFPVYCAEVPEHHAFVLSDLLVTGNCFTCHQTGNIPKLIEKLGGLRGEDYNALAIRALLEETPDSFTDWEDRESKALEPMQALDKKTYFRMYPCALEFKRARKYLADRRISAETAKILQLRYDPDEKRILFPVFSGVDSKLYGFTGRTVVDSKVKVKDYSGLKKDRLILGEQLIQEGKPILLVEGLFAYANMFEVYADEFCSPIASMGSRLSDSQRDLIVDFQCPVYVLYDNDEAGRQGLFGPKRNDGKYQGGGAIDQLKSHVPTYIAEYPEGIDDPDNLTTEDVRNIVLGSGHYMA